MVKVVLEQQKSNVPTRSYNNIKLSLGATRNFQAGIRRLPSGRGRAGFLTRTAFCPRSRAVLRAC